MKNTLLGKNVVYPKQYNPALLCPIARQAKREAINSTGISFHGVDLWTAYEVSWLDQKGKPQVRIGYISIPCDSQNMVESKSFKLYLNSLNNCRFGSDEEAAHCIAEDLSRCVGGAVQVALQHLDASSTVEAISGVCLDGLDITVDCYLPNPDYLAVLGDAEVSRAVYSHLLKTNCPVTGQPDWATLWISYRGPEIEQAGLLKYLISFRDHCDFHEACVERIFADIQTRCRPVSLQVYARYTRRGGLDINPFRSSSVEFAPPQFRISRQ